MNESKEIECCGGPMDGKKVDARGIENGFTVPESEAVKQLEKGRYRYFTRIKNARYEPRKNDLSKYDFIGYEKP